MTFCFLPDSITQPAYDLSQDPERPKVFRKTGIRWTGDRLAPVTRTTAFSIFLGNSKGRGEPGSSNLDDDLALRTPLGEVCKRILCLLERKHLVDHWPDALRLEELADFGELIAIGARKEK